MLNLVRAVMLSVVLAVPAVAKEPAPVSRPAKVDMWNTEQFLFPSKVLGRDVLIQVAKPGKPQEKPVAAVYILDGDAMFVTAANNAMLSGVIGEIAPAYFIGVAFPDQDITTWLKARTADLIHVDVSAKPQGKNMASGKGDIYQRFLVEELRPAINARYPVDPKRTVLAGYSLGGLFATHILVNTPDAFQDYLIGSPSIWVEPELIAQVAKLGPLDPSKRVFVSVGENEVPMMTKGAKDLANALRDGPSGVKVQEWFMPGETHTSAPPAFYSRALRFALPPAPKSLAPPKP